MKYEHKKDMLRFYFDGELDNLSVMRLKEESIALIERFRPQVLKLDFASVTFVDSTGIGYVLARYRQMQKLHGEVVICNLSDVNKKIFEKCLLYLDPPYFNKGNQLYTNHYKYQDHAKIAKCVNRLKGKWIVSYDNTPEIIDLYKFVESNNIREFNIAYSAAEGKNKKGKEIMFFAPKSIIPQCKIC